MKEATTLQPERSRPEFECLEAWVRLKVKEFVQGILEEEVESLLGRARHGAHGAASLVLALRVESYA